MKKIKYFSLILSVCAGLSLAQSLPDLKSEPNDVLQAANIDPNRYVSLNEQYIGGGADNYQASK
ncbi:MAG: hypothetical protein P8016_00705 [Sedimentisphaerales bacterium]